MVKVLYPTSLKLDVDALQGFAATLHPYDVTKPFTDDLADADVLIAWSNKPENLKDGASRLKNLKWIQSLAAGPNDVLNAGFDSSKISITTGSGLHDHTVAEHALGLLLNACRRFYEMRDYQLRSEWPQHLGGAQPDRPKGKFTSLRGANVLIWGYGNIGKTLTPHLVSLGANVRGVARSAGVRNGVEVLSESQLAQALPETDALVMILPGSESTTNALNAERMKLLPNHAWVVNVGRGTTIDEEALFNALNSGEIGGAALDVFVQEPLPKESKLWKAPNVIISPHAAGGRPQEAEELIAYNLRRFCAEQSLKNVI
ncbi:D-isomer specific 2-hydroxyacid dehydrogenase [Teratosphaeria nubilosa]|uniref:D-isomer specific 2-hydroxyacid dehydrogenase n=1 Tax=Teratosphaeria nubilosa TaxID=161662 RepID=A0A6G1LCU2_9PEZI|nr:D-isomer specific 2-hydroxyacid dehydrogenase [Teratosphaeria nubilosa]